jgi:CheY-like chemotaxis protein
MGRRILIDAGYEVITVNNGSAALKKIHESRPDLIVLDVYMPGYGGLEVCQRLKESSETSRIPILLTVGKMEPFKPEEAKRARADGHIVKPFDASELLAALTKLEDRIVPQAEPPRGRKSKSEKKSRSWQVADPAASYDDTHSEKISYLAEVKQKHSSSERRIDQPADADVNSADAQEETPRTPEKPRMAMPMSVYAAEQLRELPVIAEPSPAAEEMQAQESSGQNASSEPQTDVVAAAPAIEPKPEPVVAEGTTVEEIAPAGPSSEESLQQNPASEVEQAPASMAGGSPAEQLPAAAESGETAPKPEEIASAQTAPQSSRWIAENVAVSAEEAALELDREMQNAQTSVQHSVEARSENVEAGSSDAQSEASPTDSEETDGATFAAAAGASASSTSAVSTSESEPESPVPSETVAAWQNWQHIKDSVMGSQTAVSLTQSVVEAVQASTTSEEQSANAAVVPAEEKISEVASEDKSIEPGADANSREAAAEADESAALSSIVDSVLAELRPKLMAEISKKLKK